MHNIKNTILFSLLASFLLLSCASNFEKKENTIAYETQKQEKQTLLEETFANLLSQIRNNALPEDLLPFITDSSEYWLDSLEVAAKTETKEMLSERSFCEIYAILLYRIYEREHLWNVSEDRMLSLVLAKKGILDRLTELQLGKMEIKNDRGSVGLKTSPKVPVILFVWDDVKWELDLKASLPLVTKGIESIGVKKDWSNTKLALYLLEKEYRYDFSFIDESLLEPIPF